MILLVVLLIVAIICYINFEKEMVEYIVAQIEEDDEDEGEE